MRVKQTADQIEDMKKERKSDDRRRPMIVRKRNGRESSLLGLASSIGIK